MNEQDIARLVSELNSECWSDKSKLPPPFAFGSDGCVCWVELYGTAIWTDDNDSRNISQIRNIFLNSMLEMELNFDRAKAFLANHDNFTGKYPEVEE